MNTNSKKMSQFFCRKKQKQQNNKNQHSSQMKIFVCAFSNSYRIPLKISAALNTILSQQNALIIKGAYCCKVWF
jgi:hypothetical protein